MCKIICVTNRHLCRDDFLLRVERICRAGVDYILLREKDMNASDYTRLAKQVDEICYENGTELIVHTHIDVASMLKRLVHLPMSLAKEGALNFGTSCHSPKEAIEAEGLRAKYLIAGHIFDTACKSGLPGRGTDFLKTICDTVSVPVYAIGGINAENAQKVIASGADGICVMSGAMRCDNVNEYFSSLRESIKK